MMKIKFNEKALKDLQKQAGEKGQAAWDRGASKHPEGSTQQQARDIAQEMKREGLEPDEKAIRRTLEGK